MPGVAVLIPTGGSCSYRQAALDYVKSWYAQTYPNWEVHEGKSPGGGDWCKGKAVADALRQTNAGTLVVGDGDSIAPYVGHAVRVVEQGRPWAMPHHMVHRISPSATEKILNQKKLPTHLRETEYDRLPYVAMAGGGITVINRDAYLRVPMDHRYIGWGQEDGAWGTALTRIFGTPHRVRSTRLWHLWHPPQPKVARTDGPTTAKELQRKYQESENIDALLAVLEEPRQYVHDVVHNNVQTPRY